MICNEVDEAMLLALISERYELKGYELTPITEHEGGRNKVYLCHSEEHEDLVIRISDLSDRTSEDYLAELEFVRFLYDHGANVANVITSNRDHLYEQIVMANGTFTVCLFQRAKGILLVENNYRYREGVSLHEYFFNCGNVLGQIHRLSKGYTPVHERYSFFDRFDEAYLDSLIPEEHILLKEKFHEILQKLRQLDQTKYTYGMLHFDFGDSNYSIDFSNGKITVYDFDNSCMGFYLYDLADVWTSGVGWVQFEPDARKRKEFMESYFHSILEGYCSETTVDGNILSLLPLFIDITILESIVDHVETMLRENSRIEWTEHLVYLEKCLVNGIPYLGFFDEIYCPTHPFE